MRFRGPKNEYGIEEWHENDALMAMYQFEKSAILNPMERRIHQLYQRVEDGIMPWMWDYENYPNGKDDEMYGQFYPEDIEAIESIKFFISQRQHKSPKLPKKLK